MAYKGFHRSVKAGVALAGAGAIAFASLPALPAGEAAAAPVVAAAPQAVAPRVVTVDVQSVALISSLQILANGARAAVEDSVDAFQNDIPAIFAQVVVQWPDINLTPWNHSLLATALLAPVAPLVVGPFNDAVAEVLARALPQYGDEIRQGLPEAIDYAFARLVGPVLSAIGATGAVHQDFYHAGMAGDRLGQNLALIAAPIKVIDGLLFGGYGDLGPLLTGEVGGPRIAAPGLFTPWGQWPVDRNVTAEPEAEVSSMLAEPRITAESDRAAAKSAVVATEDTADAVDTEAVDTEAGEPAAKRIRLFDRGLLSSADRISTEEAKASRLSIRQGIKDLRGSGKKPVEGADESADAPRADKPKKSERPERSEKAQKAEKAEKAADKDDAE